MRCRIACYCFLYKGFSVLSGNRALFRHQEHSVSSASEAKEWNIITYNPAPGRHRSSQRSGRALFASRDFWVSSSQATRNRNRSCGSFAGRRLLGLCVIKRVILLLEGRSARVVDSLQNRRAVGLQRFPNVAAQQRRSCGLLACPAAAMVECYS